MSVNINVIIHNCFQRSSFEIASSLERTANHFIIVVIAYLLLSAFGAFAEDKNFGEQLKVNTEQSRALSLATIGNHFMEFIGRTTVSMAIASLVKAPT